MTAKKKKRGKYAAAFLCAAAIILYEAAVIFGVFKLGIDEKIPVWAVALIIMIPALAAVGIIAALILRIKEIKGGEEDVASNY
jgi:hypothetical protein